jgi:anti-sigma B factor antagonist
MRIDTQAYHDVVLVQPKERITVETAAEFTGAIRTLLEGGSRRLVLDLIDVPSIDSIGLAALVQAYTSTRHCGGDLKLLHVRHRNRRLLAITKLLTVFETYDTENEAERSFETDREEAFSSLG